MFGFSKLDVMFGRTTAEHVTHRFDDLRHPGVRFLRAEVTSIDPVARGVVTSEETLDADVLVVSMGTISSTVERAVDEARERGIRLGALRAWPG